MKIAIIQERKTPPDSRVAFAPDQAKRVLDETGISVLIERSANRCYNHQSYIEQGFTIHDDISSADVLFGIKEVPIDALIPDKTYFFFSHTIKKQPYNRNLLRAILEKNITFIDYEALTDKNGQRLVAFGIFAGMVGAHNALWTYAQRHGNFYLPRMYTFENYAEAKKYYQGRQIPAMKVIVTGGGRVSSGSVKVLKDMGFTQVTPQEFLANTYKTPVFTQLRCKHYVEHKEGLPFVDTEFFANPDQYRSRFAPYSKVADILINGIYYDKRAPAFFTKKDMTQDDFSIQVIADVTCDIAPAASIPATIEASTIAEPVFGFDPSSGLKTDPFKPGFVDMMTIDNLPNELPQDASRHFGDNLIKYIIPELLGQADTNIIERATVAHKGKLTKHFAYLQDYVDGV